MSSPHSASRAMETAERIDGRLWRTGPSVMFTLRRRPRARPTYSGHRISCRASGPHDGTAGRQHRPDASCRSPSRERRVFRYPSAASSPFAAAGSGPGARSRDARRHSPAAPQYARRMRSGRGTTGRRLRTGDLAGTAPPRCSLTMAAPAVVGSRGRGRRCGRGSRAERSHETAHLCAESCKAVRSGLFRAARGGG